LHSSSVSSGEPGWRDAEKREKFPDFDSQDRAYGLRDEEYLPLKILTCMLPEICNAQNSPTHFGEELVLRRARQRA